VAWLLKRKKAGLLSQTT